MRATRGVVGTDGMGSVNGAYGRIVVAAIRPNDTAGDAVVFDPLEEFLPTSLSASSICASTSRLVHAFGAVVDGGAGVASDLRKSGRQGSMGRYAHRPCCLWFALPRVRLTKPPQIAGACELLPRCVCGLRAGRSYSRPAAIGAGFMRLVAGCGYVRPAGARELRTSAARGMNVFSAKRGKNFSLCGTPQNMIS